MMTAAISKPHSCIAILYIAVVGAMVLVAGCGDGRPERAKVLGQVLIDGAPLTHGSLSFMPVAGGRPAGGVLDGEGRFELSCFAKGDGAILGEYQVAVSGVEYLGETAQKWHAPKKYSNVKSSGLTVNVDRARDDVQIELSWDGQKPFVEKLR